MDTKRPAISVVALTDMAAQDVAPHQIAAQAVATWRSTYAALAPIIGHRGVCALYQRSLHLVCPEFPWLGAAHATALDSGDFDALRAALLQQPNAVSIAANHALLTAFCNLLGQLVGESLTARLLGELWIGTSSSPAVAGKDHD